MDGGEERRDAAALPSVTARDGGRGGRRRPSPPGADPEEVRRTALSKTLSWLLRHHAHEYGLKMRTDGYVSLREVVLLVPQIKKLKPTLSEIQDVVARCPKQRFSLIREGAGAAAGAGAGAGLAEDEKDALDGWLIRANQGHSQKTAALLADDALLEPITPANASSVECCVHGTYWANWPAIVESGGLKRMSRAHVHFASGELGADHVRSGLRSSAQLLCYLDVSRALSEGLPLFRSANGVLLSPGMGDSGLVPLRLFSRVVEAKTGKVVEWAAGAAASSGSSGSGAAGSSASAADSVDK